MKPILFTLFLSLSSLAHAGDFCPQSSQEIIRRWNWARIDDDYTMRQYGRLSEAIRRENLQSRLDSFLSNQGY